MNSCYAFVNQLTIITNPFISPLIKPVSSHRLYHNLARKTLRHRRSSIQSTIKCTVSNKPNDRQLLKANQQDQSIDTSSYFNRRTLLRVLLSTIIAYPVLLSHADKADSRVIVADPNAGETITKTSTGLQYFDFVSSSSSDSDSTAASSKTVHSGDQVTIQYTMGTTGARNGWRIDTSTLTFKVGENDVIQGLNEGVVGMRKGDRRRLVVPPSLGYHSQNDKPIPKGFAEFQRFKNIYLNVNRPFLPDAVFDVTVLKIL